MGSEFPGYSTIVRASTYGSQQARSGDGTYTQNSW